MTALLASPGKAPACGQCGKQYDPQLVDLWLHARGAHMQCNYCHETWGELQWSPAEKEHPRGHYKRWTIQDRARVKSLRAQGYAQGVIARMLGMPLGTVWYMIHA